MAPGCRRRGPLPLGGRGRVCRPPRLRGRGPCARLRRGRRRASVRASRCCSTRRPSSAGWAPAARHRRRGARTALPRPSTTSPGAGAPRQGALHAVQMMVLGVDEQDSPSTTPSSPTRTTSPGCRSSSPTCTRPCRRCSPGPARRGAGCRVAYVMTDGGALPLGLLPHRGRAAGGRLADGVDHGRAGLRRRPRGRQRPHRPAGRPPRRAAPTSSSSPRARATSARAPAGASRASAGEAVNAAACWVAARWRRCGSPRRTRASGTAASPPQPARHTAGCRSCPPTWRSHCWPATLSGAGARPGARRWRRTRAVGSPARRGGRPTGSLDALRDVAGAPVDDGSRTSDDDPAAFLARPPPGAMPPGAARWSLTLRTALVAQARPSRSMTKISVSPG